MPCDLVCTVTCHGARRMDRSYDFIELKNSGGTLWVYQGIRIDKDYCLSVITAIGTVEHFGC